MADPQQNQSNPATAGGQQAGDNGQQTAGQQQAGQQPVSTTGATGQQPVPPVQPAVQQVPQPQTQGTPMPAGQQGQQSQQPIPPQPAPGMMPGQGYYQQPYGMPPQGMMSGAGMPGMYQPPMQQPYAPMYGPPMGYPQQGMGMPGTGMPPPPPGGFGGTAGGATGQAQQKLSNFRFGEWQKNFTTTIKIPAHSLKFDEGYFLKLLAGSISLTRDEKKRIIESVPKLRQQQVDELIRIFEEEKTKFIELSPKHGDQLEKLEKKHREDWRDLETVMVQEGKKQEDTAKADEIRKKLGLA